MGLRLTTWNVAWFGKLLQGKERDLFGETVTSAAGKALQRLQREKIAEEIVRIDPDVLCINEGPSTGSIGLLKTFCEKDLAGRWTVIDRPPREKFHILGSQGIFFLVRTTKLDIWQPRLLPVSAWREATTLESRTDPHEPGSADRDNGVWTIVHPLFKPETDPRVDDEGNPLPDIGERGHEHFRHPQVLTVTVGDRRVDIIGCHLKSKRIDPLLNKAAPLRRRDTATLTPDEVRLLALAEQEAVQARIKLTTEVNDIRLYIDSRFRNEPDPVVFVVGDLNDGVGKEVFERKYLFHDMISNLQGDVFFAQRFLNHALFDYSQEGAENHRWTVQFSDPWDPFRPPEILLDHIVFTQSVTGPEALEKTGLRVMPRAGRVEHVIHNAVNAVFDRKEDFTSDHRAVTVDVVLSTDPSA